MLIFIVNWFRKKVLGQHVCEEFTQWEYKEAPWTLISYLSGDTKTREITKIWQERRCTLCGRIQQEELKF